MLRKILTNKIIFFYGTTGITLGVLGAIILGGSGAG